MDKSRWPQEWKDQYNKEIRRRNDLKKARESKDKILDQIYFPRINELRLDETSFFGMIGYRFPFHQTISRIICRFISPDEEKTLALSPRYLFYTQHIFPGYYTDKERIIAIMNRYRATGDVNEFVKWIQFQEDKSTFHFIHVMVALIYLDLFIEDQRRHSECLHHSINHFEKAINLFIDPKASMVFDSLIAFAYYLDRDFNSSLRHIRSKNNQFKNDFIELIKKVG